MDSDYGYRFSACAEQDLDDILKYISVDLSNLQVAQSFGKKVFESIGVIRTFPESGMLVDNEFLADKTVRKALVDNYIVYYKTDDVERMLYIIRIVYAKRNLDEILKNL